MSITSSSPSPPGSVVRRLLTLGLALFLSTAVGLFAGCDNGQLTAPDSTSASSADPITSATSDEPRVLMQGFYWDSPQESGSGEWWDFVSGKIPTLASDGFTEIWLPPASKAQNDPSMGYDPYDYYDLGEYNQKMGTETWFGSRQELESLISTAHSNNMDVIADIVVNHMSGGQLEYNPNTGTDTYTKFRPKSGRIQFNYDNFHPSTFEQADAGTFAGFPDLAHANPATYDEVEDYQQFLDSLGYDGWRYDFVKGINPQYIEQLQGAVGGFGVGEYYDGNKSKLSQWLNDINYSASAFDFPLHFALKDMANNTSGGYDLRNLWGAGLLWDHPFNTVTFVSNHDTDKDAPILTDKMMAYSVILTHEGLPTVFWKDYFNYNLAQRNSATGIKQLVWVYQNLAAGSTSLLHSAPDLYIIQRNGDPGLVLVLNDNPDSWKGVTINTKWANTQLHAYAWNGGSQPQDKWTDGSGNVDLWAPPRGYAVYAPNGY
ncbi:alpha-amylase domain-containing protein [Longibacter salinarum]|nr:alpha-amylase domain-containing protein [Longibacter salinarum]